MRNKQTIFGLLVALLMNASCTYAESEKYNCYAVGYVSEFETFITIPITENLTKEESEKIIAQEIKDAVNSTKDEKIVKTVRISDNTTETSGSGLTRYFCFPAELDNNKNDKAISDFINNLNSDIKSEKINNIFPLDDDQKSARKLTEQMDKELSKINIKSGI